MALSERELYLLEKPGVCCEDFEESLFEYFEGELGETVASKLTEHRANCTCCEQSFADYQMTVELAADLRDFPEEAAEESLSEEVEQRLREALRQRLGISLGNRADS